MHYSHAVGSAPNCVSRSICLSHFWVRLYLPAQPRPDTCSPNTKETRCAKTLSSPPLLCWVNSLSPNHLIFPLGCRIAAVSSNETKATGKQTFIPGSNTKNSPSSCFLIFWSCFYPRVAEGTWKETQSSVTGNLAGRLEERVSNSRGK